MPTNSSNSNGHSDPEGVVDAVDSFEPPKEKTVDVRFLPSGDLFVGLVDLHSKWRNVIQELRIRNVEIKQNPDLGRDIRSRKMFEDGKVYADKLGSDLNKIRTELNQRYAATDAMRFVMLESEDGEKS